MKDNTLLFIGGAGHSGTTMLAHIFNKHSCSLGVHGESRVAESFGFLQNKYAALTSAKERLDFLEKHTFYGIKFKKNTYEYGKQKPNPYQGILDNQVVTCDFQKDYIKLINEALKLYEKNFFIEKTPSNVYHADEIMQLTPNAKLLIIHRDVRDVVASLKKRYLTLLKQPEVYKHNLATKKLDKDYNLVMDAVMWQKIIKVSYKALNQYGNDRIKIVRYEDIVSQPEKSIQMICDWLGLSFEDEMLVLTSRNAADPQQKKQKGISASSVGNYASTLNDAELSVVEKYAQKGMELLELKTNTKKSLRSLKYELLSFIKIFDRVRKRVSLMKPSYLKEFIRRFFNRIKN